MLHCNKYLPVTKKKMSMEKIYQASWMQRDNDLIDNIFYFHVTHYVYTLTIKQSGGTYVNKALLYG